MYGSSIGIEIVLKVRDGSERIETKDKLPAQSCNIVFSQELRQQERAFSREVASSNSVTAAHPVGRLFLQTPAKEKAQ